MSSHTDLCAVLAGNKYFINEIFILRDRYRSNLYQVEINDKKDTKFNLTLMTFLRVARDCSVIPTHRMTTPTEMHHFSGNSLPFRRVHSTIAFGWCFGKDVHFGLSPCDQLVLWSHLDHKLSSRVDVRKGSTETNKLCIST